MAQLFDDNLNAGDDGPGTGDPGGIYGAGPVVNFSGGAGPSDLTASQLIEAPTTPVYKPVRSDGTPGLELNVTANDPSGDLVAGTYGLNSNYPAASGGSADPADENEQNNQYNRRDLSPPASVSAGQTAPAFLARMRRTNNLSGLDSNAGVSSSGPTLPVIFGRGSLMARTGGSGQLSVASGMTVRATAIAAAGGTVAATVAQGQNPFSYTPGLAKTAGPGYWIPGVSGAASVMLPGVAPFALRSDLWATLNNGSGNPVTITLDPSNPGTQNQNTQVALLTPTPDPFYTPGSINGVSTHYVASLTAIGQPVQGESGFDDSALAQTAGIAPYVPIFTTDLASQPFTVIGFVYYVQWTYRPSTPTQQATLTLNAPGATPIGSQNVSGVMALPLPAALSTQDQGTLFQEHDALANPLYAPVLVDHYLGPSATGSN